jgi:hypothetical protein
LNKNVLPTGFDSLIQTSGVDGSADAARLAVSAIEDVGMAVLTASVAEVMDAGGINSLQYVGTGLDADGTATALTCAGTDAAAPSPEEIISSRANAVVAGNIFMSPAANGCGYTISLADTDTVADGYQFLATAPNVMLWTGGYERVMGSTGTPFDATTMVVDGTSGLITAAHLNAPALMAVGLGPSSSLFNANDLGGLTSVPVYRHVSGTEYNRFVALFNIGTLAADGTLQANDQVALTAIVDGAGDTKEEELGEWDGTRNTI